MATDPDRYTEGIVLLLCGCRVRDRPAPDVTPRDAPDSETGSGAEPTNQFDPSAVAVGDSVLGLRIESIDVHPTAIDSGGWVGMVQFEGERVLSGVYRRDPFEPERDELCFFPDDGSAKTLPIFPYNERTSWLCFSNQEAAEAIFDRSSEPGVATIEVDRYLYYYSHSDVYNVARLIGVISYADPLRG